MALLAKRHVPLKKKTLSENSKTETEVKIKLAHLNITGVDNLAQHEQSKRERKNFSSYKAIHVNLNVSTQATHRYSCLINKCQDNLTWHPHHEDNPRHSFEYLSMPFFCHSRIENPAYFTLLDVPNLWVNNLQTLFFLESGHESCFLLLPLVLSWIQPLCGLDTDKLGGRKRRGGWRTGSSCLRWRSTRLNLLTRERLVFIGQSLSTEEQ